MCSHLFIKKGIRKVQKYYKKWAPIFLIPIMVCFLVAFLVPFGMGLYFSLTRYQSIDNATFIGFDNYVKAFTSLNDKTATFWVSLGRTSLFAVLSIITINLFAFILALLLTKGLKGSNMFRSIFFLPNLIGGIVLGYIWKIVFSNLFLTFGSSFSSNNWYSFFGLLVLMNWQQVGYMMVIYIAALMNIPAELNESAEIDGASKTKTTFHITIPMVIPAFTICTFLTLTNSYKLFDQNIALSGYSEETNLLAADIVNTMSGSLYGGNMGPGQAKAVVFFVIVAIIAGAQVFFTRKKEIEA